MLPIDALESISAGESVGLPYLLERALAAYSIPAAEMMSMLSEMHASDAIRWHTGGGNTAVVVFRR